MAVRLVLLLVLSGSLMGCETFKLKNLAKTGATTAITYAVAGPLPAVASMATSIVIDEVIPPDVTIEDIKTKEQAVAYVFDKGFEYTLYGIIAFLLFTNVITPYFVQRRALRRRTYDDEHKL
jgi:hypothetical protein